MLLSRHFWAQRCREECPLHVYVIMDGSPASGFEAFVAVEQVVMPDGTVHERRLPVLYLGFGHQDLKAKVYAWLWQTFLEVGPDAEVFRHKLSWTHVRSGTVGWMAAWLGGRAHSAQPLHNRKRLLGGCPGSPTQHKVLGQQSHAPQTHRVASHIVILDARPYHRLGGRGQGVRRA